MEIDSLIQQLAEIDTKIEEKDNRLQALKSEEDQLQDEVDSLLKENQHLSKIVKAGKMVEVMVEEAEAEMAILENEVDNFLELSKIISALTELTEEEQLKKEQKLKEKSEELEEKSERN
ncbi:hypothetical protein ACJIZ3_003677 [Penstemon smallii]|uniref:Uncharacterized protein n=1 Tax=Penstemon smallii TaxID=265156 RepID=A0ABD3U9W4_9LAMI